MSKKLTVAIIRNAFAEDFGGAERYAVFLAKELQKHGLKPILFSAHDKTSEFAKNQKISTQATHYLKNQNWNGWRTILLPFYLLFQIKLFFFYLRKFKKLDAKVAHLQSKDDFIAGTYAGKLLGVKIIWTDHADLKHIFKNTNKFARNLSGKLVLKASYRADKIILNSFSDKQDIEVSVPKDNAKFWKKTTVIHNGVNDQKKSYPKKSKNEIFTFTTNCRLVFDKGMRETIEAFKTLHKSFPKSQLLIAGEGPDRKELEKLASRHPAIKFIGHQKDPLQNLSQSDCFLQATYHEGLSLSLLEACMLQKTIITTKVGGNPEVITDQVNGLLVEVKNSEALLEAMLKVVKNPDFSQKLAKEARKNYQANFDFEKLVAKQIIPLYNLDLDVKSPN